MSGCHDGRPVLGRPVLGRPVLDRAAVAWVHRALATEGGRGGGRAIIAAEPLSGGYRNENIRLVTDGGSYVLRCYLRDDAARTCAIEAALAGRLAAAGVPAAEPARSPVLWQGRGRPERPPGTQRAAVIWPHRAPRRAVAEAVVTPVTKASVPPGRPCSGQKVALP